MATISPMQISSWDFPSNQTKQCFGSGSGSMWIRIEISPLDPDPCCQYGSGSRTVKMVSKKEKNLRFQFKKSNDHFAEGLMAFTRAWDSSINVFTPICDWNNIFTFIKKKNSYILSWKILDPDPYWPIMLETDQYWDQYGSETLKQSISRKWRLKKFLLRF